MFDRRHDFDLPSLRTLIVISLFTSCSFWIGAYNTLSLVMAPVWHGIGIWRKFKGKEDPEYFLERFGLYTSQRTPGPLVWLHGASIGEACSVLGLVNPLRASYEKIRILLTVQTRNALQAIRPRLPPGVDLHILPYDCPLYVKRFLHHWKPSVFCVVEAECWPCLWSMVRKQSIPCFLFNFHMSQKSFYRWHYFRKLFSYLYAPFEWRSSGCSASCGYFSHLTALSIKLTPSLKYADPVLQPHESKAHPLFSCGPRPFWLASCIHEGEEDLMLQTHRKLCVRWPNLVLFYAPRHLERIAFVEKKAAAFSWITQRHSASLPIDEKTSIYLINTLGELGTFYSLCPFVVLGGSFCTVGGHNMIEPTALGCAVITGPDASNALDVAKEFAHHKAALQVTPESLADTVSDLLENPQKAKRVAQQGQNLLVRKKRELAQISEEFARHLTSFL